MGTSQYDNDDVIIKGPDGSQATVVDGKLQTDASLSGASVDTTGNQTSSWVPNPDNTIIGKTTSSYDVSNNLNARAQILTDERSYRDDFTGTRFGTQLTGTMHFENGSTTIIGVGTAFLSEVKESQFIRYADDLTYNNYTAVATVVSDTELELVEGYLGATQSGNVNGRISNWGCTTTGSPTRTVANSIAELAVGTGSTDFFCIRNIGDYGPIIGTARFKISQRIANQEAYLGFMNEHVGNESHTAYFLFDGTSNTSVKCVSQSSANSYDKETTTLTLPADVLTSDYHRYKIEVTHNRVSFTIDDSINVIHQTHVPGPYDSMDWHCTIKNTATAASGTTIYIDFVDIANVNAVQASNAFKNDPVPTYQSEDIHVIYAKKTTTTNTADQSVIEYTVPAGRVAYLVNYSLEQDTSVTTIGKVGKNTVTTEPGAPGTVDGNILRVFRINSANPPTSSVRETFGIPLRFAHGGDVLKLTVSPSSTTSTNYRGSIDLILR